MKRTLGYAGLACALVLAAMSATAAQQTNTAASAKVDAYVRKTFPNVERRAITIDYVDLNADGQPEAFVQVGDMSECGRLGCAIVLDLSPPAAKSLGWFTSDTLRALGTATGGWKDILVSGKNTVRFKNGGYATAR